MYQELTEVLRMCATACKQCAEECAKEINAPNLAICMKLNIECADICTHTVLLIIQGSDNDKNILQKCILACNRCAEECRKHDHIDHCKKIASLCERCILSCLTTMSHLT